MRAVRRDPSLTRSRRGWRRWGVVTVLAALVAAALPVVVAAPARAEEERYGEGCWEFNQGFWNEDGSTGVGGGRSWVAGDSITITVKRTPQTVVPAYWVFEIDNEVVSRKTLMSSIQFTHTFTKDGLYPFQVYETDTGSRWATGANITLSCKPGPQDVFRIRTWGQMPGGTQDEPYREAVVVSGGTGPYAWSLVGGALPPGLTLGPSGEVTGTPSESGLFEFTAAVTDASGQSLTRDLSIDINPAGVEEQMPICHKTADGYEQASAGEEIYYGAGEHGDHSGDIVPEVFWWEGSGRNWGPDTIDIYFNGCIAPGEELLDTDQDGLADKYDADDDGDGISDVVDGDMDGDGVPNAQDADAEKVPDQDRDGLPDAIDSDDDGDCLADGVDPDRDGDGVRDAVDPDLDNDGIPNAVDVDVDGDGQPNSLDVDPDGNGTGVAGPTPDAGVATRAACAVDPDLDNDGIADTRDPDDDGDGIPDGQDAITSRPWIDTDADGEPDVTDADADGDGIPNTRDDDIDGDGVPNARDKDANGDGIVETRAQALEDTIDLAGIEAEQVFELASGPLTTTSGQKARVFVECTPARSGRSKPSGDIAAPGPQARCLVVKSGGRLRLIVSDGAPTRVSVHVFAPAADDYRTLDQVVTTVVR